MHKWDPEDYSVNSTAQLASAKELIKRLNLKGREAVLDIGCGDGKITAQIAGLVPAGSVLGVDASEEMVRFASEKFPASQYPNLSFAVKDATALDFENRFDLVFSNAALHWVSDHAAVLRGISRALKPGGKIHLHMLGKGSMSQLMQALRATLTDLRWRRYFKGFKSSSNFPEPESYRQLVKAAGLEPIRVELVPRVMTQNGREGLIGHFRSTWLSVMSRIPPDQAEEFLNRIADEFLKENPPDASGKLKVEVMGLDVEAVKP
jgi:trans-aconitate methyltransferase